MTISLDSIESYFRPGRSLLVAGFVVFATIFVNVLLITVTAALSPEVTESAVIPIGSLAVGGILAWIGNGVLLQASATLLGGRGRFRDAFVVSAWGLPPTVIAWVASLVNTIYRVVASPPSATGEPTTSPLVMVGSVAALVGTWYVWMVGLEGTHDLDRRSAAVAAGIVAVLLGGLVALH